MGEEFKVVAVVEFNKGEALVLNRPIEMVYEEVGRDFVGEDGPFRDFLGFGSSSTTMKAFAGRELTLSMKDGSVRKIKDNWWATWKKGYNDVVVKDLEGLQRCYIFNSAHITPEDYATLRATYTGPVYPYWDYEKIIKYDSERKYWIEKYFDVEKKLKSRTKRETMISSLLMGRGILLRAIGHLEDYSRIMNLKCTIPDEDGSQFVNHIGLWKAAGKEYGFENCDDEEYEMNECPLCSAQYADYKTRKLLRAKVGIINGILTRLGNKMRSEAGK